MLASSSVYLILHFLHPSGLGLALAEEFLRAGDRVLICSRSGMSNQGSFLGFLNHECRRSDDLQGSFLLADCAINT